MLLIAEIKTNNNEPIAIIALPEKEFKTGSKGYYANTKVEMNGKRYQAQVQLVEIGSKKQNEGDV